jgi:2'-5' RNA ligase
MCTGKQGAILAYWLVPAAPRKDFLASRIADLASRFEAPLFEPHVTVYAAKEANLEALNRVVAGYQAFRLTVRYIQCSDEFTKSVYVQFDPSKALSQLSREIRQASGSREEYQLDPHLSLMYKKMTRDERMEIASSIWLPFTEVVFDTAKVVICPTPIRSREDVEAWRVVATQSLAQ